MEFFYKNYKTKMHYDKEDNLYHGYILGIQDFVTFSSNTKEDFEHQFQLAVDDYLEFKKELNIKNT